MKSKYSKYKSSGVERVGEIPEHWRFMRLGFGVETIVPMRDKPEKLDGNIPWIRIEDFNGKYISSSKSNQGVSEETIEKMNLKVYPIGTVLCTCSCSFGTTMIVKKPLISNQTFIGLVPEKKKLNEEYLYYLLQVWKEELELQSSGSIQLYLSKEHFKSLKVLFPPLPEQQQIVKYLDEKTGEIDNLISITENKIELLKEKRTATINHVITKGLDPNVELKDSGIEWIGEIPQHWKVSKMKYCLRMISEKSETQKDNIKISPENVENNTGKCFDLYSDYEGEGMKFICGDILLNKLRIYLKKIVLTEYEGFSMGEMIVLRTITGLNKYYYYTLFNQGLIDLLNSQSNGVKLPRVSPEIVLNTEIVFPPFSDQEQIVKYLDQMTQEKDTLISLEQQRIETLKEYRQSLISEVVTGKIRVCEEVTV